MTVDRLAGAANSPRGWKKRQLELHPAPGCRRWPPAVGRLQLPICPRHDRRRPDLPSPVKEELAPAMLRLIHLPLLHPPHPSPSPLGVDDVRALMARARAARTPVSVLAFDLSSQSLPVLSHELQRCPNVHRLGLGSAAASPDIDAWSELLAGIAQLGPNLQEVKVDDASAVPGALHDGRVLSALSTSTVRLWDVSRATLEDGVAVIEAAADNSGIEVLRVRLHERVAGSAALWSAARSVAEGASGPSRLELILDADAETDADGIAALVGSHPRPERRFRLYLQPTSSQCKDQSTVVPVVRALRSAGWPAWVQASGLRMSGLDVEREVIADMRADAMEGLHMSWHVSREVMDVLAEELPRMTRLTELGVDSVLMVPSCRPKLTPALARGLSRLPDRRLEVQLSVDATTARGRQSASGHPMRQLVGLLESEHHRSLRIRPKTTAADLRRLRLLRGGAPWQDALAGRMDRQDAWDSAWRVRGGLVMWRRAACHA